MGWHGVNVDANQELIELFQKVRKRDVNLCIAVGLESRYKFTIFDEPALSTFNSEWKARFIRENNRIAREIEVQGRTLRNIVNEFYPQTPVDLLSIDAEGADLQVLQSLYFNTLEKSRFPKWILLEASPPVDNALSTPAVKLAIQWGYEPHMVLAMSTLLKLKE
jgi:FkbM family methyltransferase